MTYYDIQAKFVKKIFNIHQQFDIFDISTSSMTVRWFDRLTNTSTGSVTAAGSLTAASSMTEMFKTFCLLFKIKLYLCRTK